MIILICAFIFISEISCLHILPCEPGDPGPLGCDQYVRNGGQLGVGQTNNPGNVGTFGTGSENSIGSLANDASFLNIQNIAGIQFIDPTQIANPSHFVDPTTQFLDPTTQFVDPTTQILDPTTQFLDPASQFIDPTFTGQSFAGTVGQLDPTMQFIDPTQVVDPSFNGAVGVGQLDQPTGPFTTGLDFVGKSKMSMSYPKGKFTTKGKTIAKGYPKGMIIKKSVGGYPKRLMVRYPKKYVKKGILGYPKGKIPTYSKYRNVYGKPLYKSQKYQKAYRYPKNYKIVRYLKKKSMIGGYPKFGLRMKTGNGRSYSKGYPKFSIRSKKSLGGY